MSDVLDSTGAESSGKTSSACGTEVKEKLLTQARQEPAKLILMVLAGSTLTGLLIGYFIFRMEAESRRQRLIEDWMQDVTDWIREHGRSIAAPVKGGLEAARTAVEEVSRSGAQARARLQPLFFGKRKRSLPGLF
ncbi:MAG TPA: hypothetical protein VE860_17690 [Chthoniobacterales bacterium]|jgi:hypothetical protein|nr:hypothetical protein [Chthoniobacterales bacterium]